MKQIVIVVGFIFILASCTAYRPFTIQKLSENGQKTIWLSGKEYSSYESDGISYSVAFDGYVNGYNRFRISITNTSNEEIIVDPCAFYLEGDKLIKRQYLLDKDKFILKKVRAYNPEDMIKRINRSIAVTQSHQATDANMDLLFSMVELAGGISDMASGRHKTSRELENERDARIERELDDQKSDRDNDRRLNMLDAEKKFWETETIRKTTLFPGQSISGLVLFGACFYNKLTLYLPDGIAIDLIGS